MTATSADGGSAQRGVIALVAGRLAAGRTVKGGAEGVDGVALEAESDVGVDGGGDADVGVAEEFLDDEFDALFQEQGGGRVAEVVEADAAEAGLAEERGEGAGEVGRVDRPALWRGGHVPVVLPLGSCRVPFARLLLVVVLQRLEAAGGEGDVALGGPGLDLLQGSGEDPVQGVAAEAGADRLSRAVAFGQVTPGDPGPAPVDHPVAHPAVLHTRPARRGPRYQRSEQLPLTVGEFMTTYHPTMIHHLVIFEDGPKRRPVRE